MKRYKYQKTPLVEVIFQLRFPTILKINNNEPVEFQEAVRQAYPLYQVVTQTTNKVMPNGKEQVINKTNNYQFTTLDGKRKINLTSSFIAISTLDYNQWENFIKEVCQIEEIFRNIYTPSIYTRIGLRYKDLILRSKWNLQACPWRELLQPHVLGILKDNEDITNIYSVKTETKDVDKHIATLKTFNLVRVDSANEDAFLIDCDYYVNDPTTFDRFVDVAEILHEESANFISTAITEKLSVAMEPIEIGE